MNRHVIILGAPRSGTSLTANILHDFGYFVDFGYKNEFNSRGYWENVKLTRLNGAILNYFGGSLEHLPVLPKKWESRKTLRLLDDEAKRIINRMDHHAAWALKDAQFSLTLPFWRRLLPEDTKYVVCARNPIDQASSDQLSTTSNHVKLDLIYGLKLWANYMVSAVANTPVNGERILVWYEDYFTDLNQVSKLADFLEVDVRDTSTIDANLRHFHSDRSPDFKYPKAISEIYAELRHSIQPRCVGHWFDVSEPLWRQLLNSVKGRVAILVGIDSVIALRDLVPWKERI